MIEERVQEHARSGEQLDLAGHELDAEVLYELLVGEDVAARSVRLRGAVVTGPLDLEGTSMNAEQLETRGELELSGCTLTGEPARSSWAEHGSRGTAFNPVIYSSIC